MSFGSLTPIDEVQYAVEIPLGETSTQLVLAQDYEDAVNIQKRHQIDSNSKTTIKTRRILVTPWLNAE